jgi:hypothetical protein
MRREESKRIKALDMIELEQMMDESVQLDGVMR